MVGGGGINGEEGRVLWVRGFDRVGVGGPGEV